MDNPAEQIAELRLRAKTIGISAEETALMRSLAERRPTTRQIPTIKADDVKLSFPQKLLAFLLP